MSVVTARYRVDKSGHVDVPAREDGEPFAWGMTYAQTTRVAWADSVEELCGVLAGEPDYMQMTAQEQLVVRIRLAVKMQVFAQAAIVFGATQRGDMENLTENERQVLLAPRFEQPYGWSRDLLGFDEWNARKVPLILVTTGYIEREMPRGPEECLWWICPLTAENLLQTLTECFLVDVWSLSE